MWQAIEQQIQRATNSQFQLTSKHSVAGGDINQAYRLTDNNSHTHYFCKLNDKHKLRMFDAEAYALEVIKQADIIACPKVIAIGQTLDKSFLVLSYHQFINANDDLWFQLGCQLATLHQSTTHGQFGFQDDNFIGSTPQPNAWASNWRTFFAEKRIAWQLQLLHEKSIHLGDIDFIVSTCHQILTHHQVAPCLVHGDLWQGNVGFTKEGPIIFDPACYYGDREVDMAMTELFGHFPSPFYLGYKQTYALPPDYEYRKYVYNLYHILNHANLFAGIYIEQAKALISRILALVK